MHLTGSTTPMQTAQAQQAPTQECLTWHNISPVLPERNKDRLGALFYRLEAAASLYFNISGVSTCLVKDDGSLASTLGEPKITGHFANNALQIRQNYFILLYFPKC